jgi:hypothetical protein
MAIDSTQKMKLIQKAKQMGVKTYALLASLFI